MSTWTVILLVYLAGCMGFLVPTARFFLREFNDDDYVNAAVMSLGSVWFWPFYIPGWWIVQMLKNDKAGSKRR